jgi:hypothetical protein
MVNVKQLKGYGEHKGKYVGLVRFQNDEYESFQFNIRPDIATRYIELISQDLVIAASELGDNLIKSLGLELPQRKESK